MMATLRRWMIGVQIWAMAWVAAHIVATEPVPMRYRRPYGPAIWRATYWRADGTYSVQFYRNGECVAASTDHLLRRAFQRARRNARVVRRDRGRRAVSP